MTDEDKRNYLEVLSLENTPLRDLLTPQKALVPNHNHLVQEPEPARETKKYDLEEKVIGPPESAPINRAPAHAKPIKQRFGEYEVRTWDIYENSNDSYFLNGKLSLSKIKKEKIIGFLPFEREKIEWQSIIDTNLPSTGCEFYHPRKIADVIVQDLKTRGIEVNHQKTEELLVIALTPYVNLAKYYCIDLKKCKELYRYNKRCRLD
ncbi:MAG: hypothetical protein Q7S33_01980 [Nanoarchaeota archaeon]|nr:hypothetical protein [Nanoarchaeota archaeon]